MRLEQEKVRIREIHDAIADARTKVVSFDVFDTLLVRPGLEPTDLFHLIEEKLEYLGIPKFPFVSARRSAERKTRQRLRKALPHYDDVTLEEIYEVLGSGYRLTEEQCATLMAYELELELRYLTPRRQGALFFEFAKRSGKKVIITSDVYLPATFLIKALSRAEFSGIDRYYVSSELRKSKGSGNLFSLIISDLNLRPDEIVHIGDNARADCSVPLQMKIRAFHYPKTLELMESARTQWSQLAPWIKDAEPGLKLVLGQAFNEHFDTIPRGGWNSESLFNGNPYLLGYLGVGPLVFFTAKWLLQETLKSKTEHIAFIARDGLLVRHAYDIMRRYFPAAPTSSYLRISRAACFPHEVTTEQQIITSNDVLYCSGGSSVESVLRQRLYFEDIDKEFSTYLEERGFRLSDPVHDFHEFMGVVLGYGSKALTELCAQRDMSAAYYRSIFKGKGKIAVFDCGYSGRVQKVLSEIIPADIEGYYFASFEKMGEIDRKGLKYQNFMAAPYNRKVDQGDICTALFELLISELDAGTVERFRMTDSGVPEPVLADADIPVRTARLVSSVQRGCLDFVRCMTTFFGEDIVHLHASPRSASKLLRLFMGNPTAPDAKIFEDIKFSMGMIGEADKFIVASDIRKSVWPQGYSAIYTEVGKSRQPGHFNISSPALSANRSEIYAPKLNGNRVEYGPTKLSPRLGKLRVLPGDKYLDAVSLFAKGAVSPGLRHDCRQIIRDRSKWFAAATLLDGSGGIWRSRANPFDKVVAQWVLWSWRRKSARRAR